MVLECTVRCAERSSGDGTNACRGAVCQGCAAGGRGVGNPVRQLLSSQVCGGGGLVIYS